MMDTGRTRVPSQVSRICAEVCLWRKTKEILPARKRFSLVRSWIEFWFHFSAYFHFYHIFFQVVNYIQCLWEQCWQAVRRVRLSSWIANSAAGAEGPREKGLCSHQGSQIHVSRAAPCSSEETEAIKATALVAKAGRHNETSGIQWVSWCNCLVPPKCFFFSLTADAFTCPQPPLLASALAGFLFFSFQLIPLCVLSLDLAM